MFAFESPLFWYKLVFMAELLIIEYLFTYKLKKRRLYGLRLAAHAAICLGVTFLFPLFYYNAVYTSAMFLILFAVTALTLKLVYAEAWMSLIFATLAAYTVQHLAYEIYIFLIVVLQLDNGASMGAYGDDGSGLTYTPWTALVYAGAYLFTYWLMFVLFGDRIDAHGQLMRVGGIKFTFLSGCILFVNIVFNAVVTYRSEVNYDAVYIGVIHLSNILCCLFALLMQFGLFTREKLENELVTIKQLWQKDKEQYTLSKENIEIINLKCHDLRHQIREIGNRRVIDRSVIREIESAIKIYDSAVKTGNEALDVVLTEKSLYCQNNQITCTYVIDGKGVDFMTPADIYSLFGNAIENAIEAVLKIDEVEKRLLNLTIRRAGRFISVRLDNCTVDDIKIVDGLPVTSKQDHHFHGFGVKSIRAIVEKYGGDLSFQVEDGVFSLNIMFSAQ